MKIKWYGQANILIESADGIKIQCDPYDDSVGYRLPDFKPDIVTVSHDHFDHNAVDFVKGRPMVIREANREHSLDGVTIEGVELYHDDVKGARRGRNIVYKINIDNINFIHMGDIGHLLSRETVQMLRPCDIVAIPVGGRYTIDGKKAAEIVKALSPSLVIPIHYDTPSNRLGLNNADEFLSNFIDIRRSRVWEGKRRDLNKDIVVEVLMALGEFNHE